MTTYLLDTTVLVDYFRGRQHADTFLEHAVSEGHALALCSISVAELFSGLPERQRPPARELIDSVNYLEVPPEVAQLAGTIRFDAARKGITIHLPDAIVAAVAIANNATLVTANVRHFPMEELHLLELPSN
jgi:predicted nucleic acid-binding protein